MSEQGNETTTEATDTEAEETTATEATEAPQEGEQEAPEEVEDDWRKDFNPDKAAERIRKLQSEAKNLRTRAKEAEQKAEGVGEKDKRISALEATNLRYEVAFDLGLPKELAVRLQGNTKDEMLADAEALVKLVGTPKAAPSRKPVEALRGGGDPDREPEETDVRKLGERMFTR